MRDSLQVAMPLESSGEEEELSPKTIFGFSWKEFLVLLIGLSIGIYLLVYFGRRLYKKLKQRKAIYRTSEAYFFKQFLIATQSKKSVKIINSLYKWMDKLKLKEPTIHFFVNSYGQGILEKDLSSIINASNDGSNMELNTKHWVQARKSYLNAIHNKTSNNSSDWVNP